MAQRGIWKKNDQSNNMSKGESIGQGSVGAQSDNNGGLVEAHGTEATKGMSMSSGMSDFFSDDF